MKVLIRGLILLAAAGGFCIALSAAAQADVVTPKSAYQPASVGLLEKGPTAAAAAAALEADAAKSPATVPDEAPAPSVEAVEATPAPEQQIIRQAPTALAPTQAEHAPSLADRVVHPLRVGLEHIRTSLGRVVSACEGTFPTAAGGPVLLLGVLSMAVPFIRRRVFGIRWATDEDAPEFLFAGELTPPG